MSNKPSMSEEGSMLLLKRLYFATAVVAAVFLIVTLF